MQVGGVGLEHAGRWGEGWSMKVGGAGAGACR